MFPARIFLFPTVRKVIHHATTKKPEIGNDLSVVNIHTGHHFGNSTNVMEHTSSGVLPTFLTH